MARNSSDVNQKRHKQSKPASEAKKRHTNASLPRVTNVKIDERANSSSDLRYNLRSQTPLNRKLKQKTAPAEPGTVRRTKTQHFKIKQQEKKKRISLLKNRLILVLMCYAVIMPICLVGFWLWLPRHSTPETNDYTYQVGKDGEVISRKIYPWEHVREGKTYYIDMTALAELCSMTTTGDDKSVKYTVRETGENIEFIFGVSEATINGVVDRMDGNAYLHGGNVFVPMDFVNRCFQGISASVDTEKNKITVFREVNDEDEYITVSFPYKPTVLSESIDFYSLDQAIIDEILFREEAGKLPENGTE